MKSMTRWMLLALALALCAALPTVALAEAPAQAEQGAPVMALDPDALAEGGTLLPGLTGGMTREEVEAAGYALAEEPLSDYTREDGRVHSLTYALMSDRVRLALDGRPLVGPEVQFANGRLLGLSAGLAETTDAEALLARLEALLGAPELMGEEAAMYAWQLGEGETALRLALVTQTDDGGIRHASFHVNFPWVLEAARSDGAEQ